MGERAGIEQVTLSEAQIPSHNHTMRTLLGVGDSKDPSNRYPATQGGDGKLYYNNPPAGQTGNMNAASIGTTGGSQAHENRQPYLSLNFIIALVGLYPSRS